MAVLRERLAARLMHRTVIDSVARDAAADPASVDELLTLLDDSRTEVAWHAAWALEKIAARDPDRIAGRRAEFERRAMAESHQGKQRLLLSIVHHLPEAEEMNIDLLDFCLEEIFRPRISTASRSLCGKIAYSLCRRHAELRDELRAVMENADDECLPAAVASVRRNILKQLNKKMK